MNAEQITEVRSKLKELIDVVDKLENQALQESTEHFFSNSKETKSLMYALSQLQCSANQLITVDQHLQEAERKLKT